MEVVVHEEDGVRVDVRRESGLSTSDIQLRRTDTGIWVECIQATSRRYQNAAQYPTLSQEDFDHQPPMVRISVPRDAKLLSFGCRGLVTDVDDVTVFQKGGHVTVHRPMKAKVFASGGAGVKILSERDFPANDVDINLSGGSKLRVDGLSGPVKVTADRAATASLENVGLGIATLRTFDDGLIAVSGTADVIQLEGTGNVTFNGKDLGALSTGRPVDARANLPGDFGR